MIFVTPTIMKYTKPSDFKINPNKSQNTKCTCIAKGEIFPPCLDKGICPTLRILNVYKGVKIKRGKIQIVFKGVRKENEGFQKVLEFLIVKR
jgi:hypothetical protein